MVQEDWTRNVSVEQSHAGDVTVKCQPFDFLVTGTVMLHPTPALQHQKNFDTYSE